MTGTLPFEDDNISALCCRIRKGKFDDKSLDIPKMALDLIQRMLDPDPISRITMEQIKAHPWYRVRLPKYTDLEESWLNEKVITLSNKPNNRNQEIDLEIFESCNRLPEFSGLAVPEKLLKERILTTTKTTFTVAYELMLDNKLRKHKKLVKDITPLPNPFFAPIEKKTVKNSQDDYECFEKDNQNFLPNFEYGFKCKLKGDLLAKNLSEYLKLRNLE